MRGFASKVMCVVKAATTQARRPRDFPPHKMTPGWGQGWGQLAPGLKIQEKRRRNPLHVAPEVEQRLPHGAKAHEVGDVAERDEAHGRDVVDHHVCGIGTRAGGWCQGNDAPQVGGGFMYV